MSWKVNKRFTFFYFVKKIIVFLGKFLIQYKRKK